LLHGKHIGNKIFGIRVALKMKRQGLRARNAKS